jgi:hypothetical protein
MPQRDMFAQREKLRRVKGETEMKQLLIMYTFIGGILRGALAEQATSPVRQKI